MFKLGVLVSGGGTNLQAIIDRIEDGTLKDIQIASVVSSKEDAYALTRANQHGANNVFIGVKSFESKDDYERAIIKHFESFNVDLIVLAGFNKILGSIFIDRYEGKIINIHPALIPSFSGQGYYGLKVHEAALERGVKLTGATVHFVNKGADEGPIIIQKAIYINEDDTPETLQRRVMEEVEWKIMPEAISLISQGRVKIEGNITRII